MVGSQLKGESQKLKWASGAGYGSLAVPSHRWCPTPRSAPAGREAPWQAWHDLLVLPSLDPITRYGHLLKSH